MPIKYQLLPSHRLSKDPKNIATVRKLWRRAPFLLIDVYWCILIDDFSNILPHVIANIPMTFQEHTAGARIIERSQEYKSTVKYRTFVLLRVPIPRGVGKFNYRTGIPSIIKFPRSIINFPRSIIKLLLAPIYNFWHWHDIYCIFVHIQSIKWRFNEDLLRIWWGNEDKMQMKWRFDEKTRIKWG